MAGMGVGFILLYSLERESSPVNESDFENIARTLAGVLLSGFKGGAHDCG